MEGGQGGWGQMPGMGVTGGYGAPGGYGLAGFVFGVWTLELRLEGWGLSSEG